MLKEKAMAFNLNGETYISVSKAYQTAQENANHNDFIYLGGSTFVVAEIL
jgi:dihydrofolate synthase/folylpolyglutamate synthase